MPVTINGSTGLTANDGSVFTNASGNVGIGTSSPKTRLQSTASANLNAPSLGSATSAPFYLTNTDPAYGLLSGVSAGDGHAWLQAQRTDGTATAYNITLNEAGGNVGIGTSSPGQRLEVANSSTNTTFGTVGNQLLIRNSGSTVNAFARMDFALGASNNPTASIAATVSNYGTGATDLLFGTFNTGGGVVAERARIDTSGNFLVGKTAITSSVVGAYLSNTGILRSTQTASNSYADFYNASGSSIGYIANTSNTSTVYATTSDYRLKEDVAPMTGALSKVAALKPCTYKWKVDGSDGQGFIAHELAEVVPGCVTGEKDAVDADGNPVYQGIDTSFLVATLTAAIQELKAELDTVKTELAALKGAQA